jgi:hypothetical protein
MDLFYTIAFSEIKVNRPRVWIPQYDWWVILEIGRTIGFPL